MRAWSVLWLLAIGVCLVMVLALSGCASSRAMTDAEGAAIARHLEQK